MVIAPNTPEIIFASKQVVVTSEKATSTNSVKIFIRNSLGRKGTFGSPAAPGLLNYL